MRWQVQTLKSPRTYQEWLDCLEILKQGKAHRSNLYECLLSASFLGTEVTNVALQRQIVDAINVALKNSTSSFLKNVNESILFHEVSQVDLLFRRWKKEVKVFLFFEKLDCLPEDFREKLSKAIREKLSEFWAEMIKFLYEQSLECPSSDFEDTLFLVKRIKLFE